MSLPENKKCYLCNCSDFELVDGVVRDNPNLKILKCKNCSLVTLSSDDHIKSDFYENGQMHNGFFNPVAWAENSLADDKRRFNFLKKQMKNRVVVDFGCGAGGFLKLGRATCQKIIGIELEKLQREYLIENGLTVFSRMDEIDCKADLITMFHVLEHVKEPVALLADMKSYLNDKNSQIIIEVPSSNDALITLYKSKAFSRFTWWGCHVFTYNKDTLIKIVKKAGYKVNYVKKVQRYGIFNHLYWLFAGKPGGHNKFKFLYFLPLEFIYSKFLSLINKTDTILISISLY